MRMRTVVEEVACSATLSLLISQVHSLLEKTLSWCWVIMKSWNLQHWGLQTWRLHCIFFYSLISLYVCWFLGLCKKCGNADDSRLLTCLCYSLGVEPVDRDVVKQKPRDVKEPMITRSLIVNVLLSAFIIIAGTLWVFKREVCSVGGIEMISSQRYFVWQLTSLLLSHCWVWQQAVWHALLLHFAVSLGSM
jgi:hypothetical protein